MLARNLDCKGFQDPILTQRLGVWRRGGARIEGPMPPKLDTFPEGDVDLIGASQLGSLDHCYAFFASVVRSAAERRRGLHNIHRLYAGC